MEDPNDQYFSELIQLQEENLDPFFQLVLWPGVGGLEETTGSG